MSHDVYRSAKYGVISTSLKELPAGEPRFLLRAQDSLAAHSIRCYAFTRAAVGDQEGAAACLAIADEFDRWSTKKLPT